MGKLSLHLCSGLSRERALVFFQWAPCVVRGPAGLGAAGRDWGAPVAWQGSIANDFSLPREVPLAVLSAAPQPSRACCLSALAGPCRSLLSSCPFADGNREKAEHDPGSDHAVPVARGESVFVLRARGGGFILSACVACGCGGQRPGKAARAALAYASWMVHG